MELAPSLSHQQKRIHTVNFRHLIMWGEFNVVSDSAIDTNSLRQRLTNDLHTFITEESLYDVWRSVHGSEKEDTFYPSALHVHSRIDMFLVDQSTLF